MRSEAHTLVKHTAIYTVGTVMRNVATFLMLPIYTRFLTPADYGVIELLSMIVDFFAIIFGLRIGEAVFRYYAAAEDRREKNQVITTALALVGSLTLLGLFIVVAAAEPLSLWVFGDAAYAREIRIFALTLPLAALTEVAFLYLRAEGRAWMFVGFSMLKLALQLGLNVYFVVIHEMHVEGVIYSAVLSSAVVSSLLLAFTAHGTGLSVSLPTAGALARFSWPLIISALATFYLTFGGRYLLQTFSGPAEVGIYSLGYKFGFLLLVLAWGPFATAWDARRFTIAKTMEGARIFGSVFTLISMVVIGFALSIAIFVGDLLVIMSNEPFWAASQIVPIVLVAYVFQAWAAFSNLGILVSGRTVHLALATALGCLVLTLSSLALVPRFGMTGAAVSTMAAFVAKFLWVYRVSKRYYDMKLDWAKVLKIAGLALGIYAVSLISPSDLAGSIALHALELAAFFFLLLTLPILSAGERGRILEVLKNPRRARALLSGAGRGEQAGVRREAA